MSVRINLVFIFQDWSSEWDEWHDKDSPSLQPYDLDGDAADLSIGAAAGLRKVQRPNPVSEPTVPARSRRSSAQLVPDKVSPFKLKDQGRNTSSARVPASNTAMPTTPAPPAASSTITNYADVPDIFTNHADVPDIITNHADVPDMLSLMDDIFVPSALSIPFDQLVPLLSAYHNGPEPEL